MSQTGVSIEKVIHQGLRALLTPIIAFCFRRGVRFQEFLELAKSCFIDIARAELAKGAETENLSRLSALTGLQRKDIKQRLESPPDKRQPTNLIARVIGQWQSHPDFVTPRGAPRLLSVEGSDSEFAELVRSVSADLNPYTVLFALEQSGNIIRHDRRVELKVTAYAPKKDLSAGLEMLAEDTGNLIRAIESNLFEANRTPNLHIATLFDNVCSESLHEIREWLLDRGTSLHEEVRAYIAKRDKDANPRLHAKKGGGRVALCTFSLVEAP